MTKEPVLTITEIFYYLKTVVKTKKGKSALDMPLRQILFRMVKIILSFF